MLDWIGRWRPRHLLGAWAAYWLGLFGVKLGGAVQAALHVTNLEKPAEGSMSLAIDDDVFTLLMSDTGRTVWEGAAPFSEIALWVAGPPLALWVLWLLASRRRRARLADDPSGLERGEPASMLGAPPPEGNGPSAARQQESVRRTPPDAPPPPLRRPTG